MRISSKHSTITAFSVVDWLLARLSPVETRKEGILVVSYGIRTATRRLIELS